MSELVYSTPTPIEYSNVRVSKTEGIIEAYSAIWGIVPYARQPAILAPSVFSRTIDRQGTKISINFNHDMDSPNMWKNLANATDSLGTWFRGQTDMTDDNAVKIYNKVRSGFINQYSVGFDPKKVVTDKDTGLPKITEGYLDHHSIVNKGANPDTHTIKTYMASLAEDMETTEEDLIEYLAKKIKLNLEALDEQDQLESTLDVNPLQDTVRDQLSPHSLAELRSGKILIKRLIANGRRGKER